MNTKFEQDYTDIIGGLKDLHDLKASPALRHRFENLLIPALAAETPVFRGTFIPFKFALFGLAFVLFSGTGLVMAASYSAPGSFLYPLRQTVEGVRLSLTKNPDNRIRLHLSGADRAVVEMKESTVGGNVKALKDVSSDFSRHINGTAEELDKISTPSTDTLKSIGSQVEKQEKDLEDIKKSVPSPDQPIINSAINSSVNMQNRINSDLNLPSPSAAPDSGKENNGHSDGDQPERQNNNQNGNNQTEKGNSSDGKTETRINTNTPVASLNINGPLGL